MFENKRPDLRRWLENMVRQRKCPGLEWEDEEQMLFRLPWPHQKSRDWRPEDCQIYIEWAKHTGRYKTGDPMDFPTWKTRIRTAINKNREIEEIPNLHKRDSANPYKVYRFLPTSPRLRRDGEKMSITSAVNNDVLPLFSLPSNQTAAVSHILSMNEQHKTYISNQFHSGGVVKTCDIPAFNLLISKNGYDSMDTTEPGNVDTMDTTQEQMSRLSFTPILQTQEEASKMSINIGYVRSNDSSNGHGLANHFTSEAVDINDEQTASPANKSSFQSQCYFHVQVLYGIPSRVVNSSAVRTKSCRLFFGSPNSRSKADSEVRTEIQMPNPENLEGIKDEIKDMINQTLFQTEGGEVILTYADGDIYAERRCLTRVFASDGVSESAFLARSKKNRPAVMTKIFDFNEKFTSELEAHLYDAGKPVPKDFCYLTFGHEILKNDENPLRIVPVYVVVKHQQAVNLRYKNAYPIDTKPLISADSDFFNSSKST